MQTKICYEVRNVCIHRIIRKGARDDVWNIIWNESAFFQVHAMPNKGSSVFLSEIGGREKTRITHKKIGLPPIQPSSLIHFNPRFNHVRKGVSIPYDPAEKKQNECMYWE